MVLKPIITALENIYTLTWDVGLFTLNLLPRISNLDTLSQKDTPVRVGRGPSILRPRKAIAGARAQL